jgi:hypothetical protein
MKLPSWSRLLRGRKKSFVSTSSLLGKKLKIRYEVGSEKGLNRLIRIESNSTNWQLSQAYGRFRLDHSR